MMITIREIAQIADDIEHQLIVRPVVGMESNYLPLQQIEQAGEMFMLGLPQGNRIKHAVSNGKFTSCVRAG